MAPMILQISDAEQERLQLLAEQQGPSLNKLMEEWATVALAQHDTHARFRAMAARGDPSRGLALLDKLDASFKGR